MSENSDQLVAAESDASPDSGETADFFKTLAVIAGGIGGAVGAAMLIEHFTDDTDPKEYSINGTRLTAEILAAYTALHGFFESDETIEGSRKLSTRQRTAANREALVKVWSTLSPADVAAFEAMPYTWADIQDYWTDFTDEEKQKIREAWSPLD